mgnify:CR=1 FL=1
MFFAKNIAYDVDKRNKFMYTVYEQFANMS